MRMEEQRRRGVVLFYFRDTQRQKIQIHMAGAPTDTYTSANADRARRSDGELGHAGAGGEKNGKHIFQPRRLFTSHFMAFGRKLLVSVERIAARGAIARVKNPKTEDR